jgi:hypothetical protein
MLHLTKDFLLHEKQRITEQLVRCRKSYAFLDTADCGEPIPNLVEELINYEDAIEQYSAELLYVTNRLYEIN